MTRRITIQHVALAQALPAGIWPSRVVEAFLSTEFEGGRHARRVDKIMALEERSN